MKTPNMNLQNSRILIAAVAAAIASQAPTTHAQTWNQTAGGTYDWKTDGNWTPNTGYPRGAGAIANLTNNIGGNITITPVNNITLGQLNIGDSDGSNSFMLNGTGTGFTFNNNASNAVITQFLSSKGDTINATINLASSLDIKNLAPTAALTFNTGRTISASTAGLKTITVTNDSVANISVQGVIADGLGQVALAVNGGAIALNGANTFTGGITLNNGNLRAHNASSLGGTGSVLTVNGGKIENVSGANVTWTASQYSMQWNGDFGFSGNRSINTGTGNNVTLGGSRIITNENTNAAGVIVAGVIDDGSGNYGITVQASNAGNLLTFSGQNTYDGGTTVGSGTLIAAKDGALGTGDVTVQNGATLTLTTGVTNDYIADDGTLSLYGTGVVNLSFTGDSDTIGSLIFNDVQQAAGTWGAVGSGAQFESTFFSGNGTLTVVPEPQTVALATMGLLGMVMMMRRRRVARGA